MKLAHSAVHYGSNTARCDMYERAYVPNVTLLNVTQEWKRGYALPLALGCGNIALAYFSLSSVRISCITNREAVHAWIDGQID